MRDRLLAVRPIEVDLIRGGGGVFDITVDGRVAYSKKATGQFPTDEEVDAILAD